MKRFFVFLLLTCLFNSAFSQEKSVNLKGKILNNDFYSDITLENILLETEIATANLNENNEFEFIIEIENADYYSLKLDDYTSVILIIAPGENIYVEFDINDVENPIVTGSTASELYYNTNAEMKVFDQKISDYTLTIENEKKEYYKKQIEANLNSLTSLILINNLTVDEYPETFKLLVEGVNDYYAINPYAKKFIDDYNSISNTAIGAEAPEINLPDEDGKYIKLSSLRGNYVLVDFWASWCKPCRMESPYIVTSYDTYHKKGFEIYSVSLDQTAESWSAAIIADDLDKWTHVSDLKYWNCEAAGPYGVSSIPANFLLDKDGKIIAKDLRGEELEAKLKEIFD